MATKTRGRVRSRSERRGLAARRGVAGFELAALLEYLANHAVSELCVVESSRGTYHLEALLTWKPGRCSLIAARGGLRTFRSMDTVVRFLRGTGIGKTVVRMELKT